MAYYSEIITVKIANGTATSARFALEQRALCGVFGLSAFDGTAIGFEVSPDQGTTWQLLEDATGTAIVVAVPINAARGVNPFKVFGWSFIRLVADATQTAERTMKLLVREV